MPCTALHLYLSPCERIKITGRLRSRLGKERALPSRDREGVGAVYPNCDVQFGQRVAGIGIIVWQNGHSFVVGDAGAGWRFIRFACFTTIKIINATIRKSTTVLMNSP